MEGHYEEFVLCSDLDNHSQQSSPFDLDLWLLNYLQSGIDDITIWTRHESSLNTLKTTQYTNAWDYHSALTAQLKTPKPIELDWAERIWNTWQQRKDHPTIAAYNNLNKEPLDLAVLNDGLSELMESREKLEANWDDVPALRTLLETTMLQFKITLTTLQSLSLERQKVSLELEKAKRRKKLDDSKMHDTVQFVLQCLDNQRDLADTILGKPDRLLREGFAIVKAVMVEVFNLPSPLEGAYDVDDAANDFGEKHDLSSDRERWDMIDNEAVEYPESSACSSEVEMTSYHRTPKRQKRSRISDNNSTALTPMTEVEVELDELRSLHARHKATRQRFKNQASIDDPFVTPKKNITTQYLLSPPPTRKTPRLSKASGTSKTPRTSMKPSTPTTPLTARMLHIPKMPVTPTKSQLRRSPRFLQNAQAQNTPPTTPKAELWLNHLKSLRVESTSTLHPDDEGGLQRERERERERLSDERTTKITRHEQQQTRGFRKRHGDFHNSEIEKATLSCAVDPDAESQSRDDRRSAKYRRQRLDRRARYRPAVARPVDTDADTTSAMQTYEHLDKYEYEDPDTDTDCTYTNTTRFNAAELRGMTKGWTSNRRATKRKRTLVRGLKEDAPVVEITVATTPQTPPSTPTQRSRTRPSETAQEHENNLSGHI